MTIREWSCRYDGCLRPAPQVRLPYTPRTIADETLTCYCMRLGHQWGMKLDELTYWLGIPKSAPLEPLEGENHQVLVDRLCAVTGRPPARFRELQVARAQDLLPVSHRRAFCRACWDERRRLDAAYLSKRWAYSWSLVCTRHPHLGLLQERSMIDVRAWPEIFARRSDWGAVPSSDEPPWWPQACDKLNFKRAQWPAFVSWLRLVQHQSATAFASGAASAELRMVVDLANYWQTKWQPDAAPGRLGAGLLNGYDDDICSERGLAGSVAERCQALLVVYRLLPHLTRADGDTPAWLKEAVFERERLAIEIDWLQLRVRQWPPQFRPRARQLFQAWRYGGHYPIRYNCQECTFDNQTPCLVRKRKPVGSWTCIFDPWPLVKESQGDRLVE